MSENYNYEVLEMSVYLSQAQRILNEVELKDEAINEAKTLLNSMTKVGGLGDLINDPKFQNIVNLLTPFLVNYKVNQVMRLLEEIAKENQKGTKFDPDTGLRKYI
jgi:hypothetical protein